MNKDCLNNLFENIEKEFEVKEITLIKVNKTTINVKLITVNDIEVSLIFDKNTIINKN